MTDYEKDLITMKEAGMIKQAEFDAMWKQLHENDAPASTEVFQEADAAQGPPTEKMVFQGLQISAGAYTARGIREQNEDSFFLGNTAGGAKDSDQAEFIAEGEGPFFFAAADGMGGHDAGDVASAFVVTQLLQVASRQTRPVDDAIIEAALKGIHAELLAEARKRGTPKMGSTVAGVVLQKGNSGFFNIGDSRVYRLRHGYLQQISEDDSLSRFVPGAKKNIITNAIGAGQETTRVASRFSNGFAVTGDLFFMCSDGVHGALDDETIANLLGRGGKPRDIARAIVERAIENDSDDNCTALVVQIGE